MYETYVFYHIETTSFSDLPLNNYILPLKIVGVPFASVKMIKKFYTAYNRNLCYYGKIVFVYIYYVLNYYRLTCKERATPLIL